jgi:hypothetical protein
VGSLVSQVGMMSVTARGIGCVDDSQTLPLA